MIFQLLDVEGLQVRCDSTPEWIRDMRMGRKSYLVNEMMTCERDKRDRDKNSTYVVRLWGKTRDGRSVCVVVQDAYQTYFRKIKKKPIVPQFCRALSDEVDRLVGFTSSATCSYVDRHTTNGFQSADGQTPDLQEWLEIKVASALAVDMVKLAMKKIFERMGLNEFDFFTPVTAQKQVAVDLNFILTSSVRPGGWVEVPDGAHPNHKFAVDVAMQLPASDVKARSDIQGFAPIRVLSFDIECISGTNAFPDPDVDEDTIISIGLSTKTLFAEDPGQADVVLMLGETAPTDLAVKSFATEGELLLAFSREVVDTRSDVIVGYNTDTFDWMYILKRCENLKKRGGLTPDEYDRCMCYSKISMKKCVPATLNVGSSALGDNPMIVPRIPGMLTIDLWFYMKKENPPGLENLKLNTVAQKYLREEKVDLPAKEMFRRYREGRDGRVLVAKYNIQDCALVTRLVENLDVIPRVLQMADVTYTTPRDILYRGQQIKVYSQILQKCKALGYVFEDVCAPENQTEYEGATVVDPKVGLYATPVVTVDFASLYPSLMRTYNLSMDTLVHDDSLSADVVNEIPNTKHRFVKAKHKRGILPLILDELLSARKDAKKEMATTTDPLMKSLMNAKQLSLKLSANSVYGACGATRGLFTCLPVAESTTATGRNMIKYTCETIVVEFPGAEILYGDTDSAFVKVPPSLSSAGAGALFEFGEAIAKRVTDSFEKGFDDKSYIVLEVEKYFDVIVFYKKKRYTGIYHEPDEPEKAKLMTKGLELVRRDSIPLTRATQEQALNALLYNKDAHEAVEIVGRSLQKILDMTTMDDIVQSKSLKAQYKAPDSLPHVRLRDLMAAREPGSEPRVGDRVYFVFVASSSDKLFEKVESMEYAKEQGLPMDKMHYINALEKPIMNLLEIPLESMNRDLLLNLRKHFDDAKDRAYSYVTNNAMTRKSDGAWVRGHATKGGVQTVIQGLHAVTSARPKKKTRVVKNEGQRSLFDFLQ